LRDRFSPSPQLDGTLELDRGLARRAAAGEQDAEEKAVFTRVMAQSHRGSKLGSHRQEVAVDGQAVSEGPVPLAQQRIAEDRPERGSKARVLVSCQDQGERIGRWPQGIG
jgi:hypothetical protein